MSAYLYILRCADNSYYVGTTIGSLDTRIAEHQAGEPSTTSKLWYFINISSG